jgi:hypothetical protein
MTSTKIADPRINWIHPPQTGPDQEPASEVDIETLMTNAGWLDTHTREEIRATLGRKAVSRGSCGLRRR